MWAPSHHDVEMAVNATMKSMKDMKDAKLKQEEDSL
jgi:hypothetical protein